MSLKDAIAKLGNDHPELIPDLLPILAKATGATSCCRKATPAPENVVRADLIRLASAKPGLRPYILPIIPRKPLPSGGRR